MAGGEQTFRTTREGALSYFIGHNEDFPQDGGFGLKVGGKSPPALVLLLLRVMLRFGWGT